jgi:hypothetical protein
VNESFAVPTGPSMRSIGDLECRTVLWPGAAVIVNARGADVGVTKPFLHLGYVGLVVERIGGGRGVVQRRVTRGGGLTPPGQMTAP